MTLVATDMFLKLAQCKAQTGGLCYAWLPTVRTCPTGSGMDLSMRRGWEVRLKMGDKCTSWERFEIPSTMVPLAIRDTCQPSSMFTDLNLGYKLEYLIREFLRDFLQKSSLEEGPRMTGSVERG